MFFFVDIDTVRLTGPDGASAEFDIWFRVFLATNAPKPAKTKVSGVNYMGATSWVSPVPDSNSGIGNSENKDFGDGFDPTVVTSPGKRTANLFAAAASQEIQPIGDRVGKDEITHQFNANPAFAFSARLGLDPETGVPVLTTHLKAGVKAYYSVV